METFPVGVFEDALTSEIAESAAEQQPLEKITKSLHDPVFAKGKCTYMYHSPCLMQNQGYYMTKM